MTNVTSKEALILAYLARHKDLDAAEREKLIATLSGPAHQLAVELTAPSEDNVLEKDDETGKKRRRLHALAS